MDAGAKEYWNQETQKNNKIKIKTVNDGSKVIINLVEKEKSIN